MSNLLAQRSFLSDDTFSHGSYLLSCVSELDDSAKLVDKGVKAGQTVHMVLQLRG